MSRTLVISASTAFNGTTPILPAAIYQPERNANAARASYTAATIGRLGFGAMLRSGLVPAIVMARSLAGAPITLGVRSLNADENLLVPGGADDPPPTLDAVVQTVTLTSRWSLPVMLGATDALILTGPAGTVELLVFDLFDDLPLNWIAGLGEDPDDCCTSSSITVTTSGELTPWTGTLYVFVDSPTPIEIDLPPLNNVDLGRGLVVVPVNAGVANVIPASGERMNGELNFGVAVSRRAGLFWRRETTWASALPIVSPGILLTNLVAGNELTMPALDSMVQTVSLNYQAWGSVRLPSSSGVPANTRVPFTRSGPESTGMVMVRPQAGQTLNGGTGRFVYIPEECEAELVRAELGWVLLVTSRNCVQEVPTGPVTVAAFAGTKTVRCTAAGAQAITLPAVADCEPNALLIIESVGGLKTATVPPGADVINGKGVAAATSIAAGTGVNLYLRPSSANTWSAL